MYQSMSTIVLFTALNVIILLWAGTLRNPFKALFALVRELLSVRQFLVLFLAMLGILLLNKLELGFEEQYLHITWDFTPWVYQIEGDIVRSIQEFFHSAWLTPVLVYFYVLVFQAVMISSVGVYLIQDNKALVYGSCCAILINYALAIPFFLWFPVNEIWSYQPAGVHFYMLDVFPGFEEIYRPMSGLNNCFPSLHTALSISMFLLSTRSGSKRWMLITGLSAVLTVLAIFTLGIHWLSDMIAGVVLALIATSAGLYLGRAIYFRAFPNNRK